MSKELCLPGGGFSSIGEYTTGKIIFKVKGFQAKKNLFATYTFRLGDKIGISDQVGVVYSVD